MKERISILGSGWLGLPLAQSLQSAGHSVRVSTTRETRMPGLRAAGQDVHRVDIGSVDSSTAEFFDTDILVSSITCKDESAFAALSGAVENSPIRKVLFISSTSVYPNDAGVVFEGDGKETAASPLFRIERLLRASSRYETTVLRFGGLFGPGRHPGRWFRRGGVVLDPDAPVNLIHLDDCIGIIESIIEQCAWGQIYNACADTHPTKFEFYTRATRDAGMPCPGFSATASIQYKLMDNRKVRSELNYSFVHPDLMTAPLD